MSLDKRQRLAQSSRSQRVVAEQLNKADLPVSQFPYETFATSEAISQKEKNASNVNEKDDKKEYWVYTATYVFYKINRETKRPSRGQDQIYRLLKLVAKNPNDIYERMNGSYTPESARNYLNFLNSGYRFNSAPNKYYPFFRDFKLQKAFLDYSFISSATQKTNSIINNPDILYGRYGVSTTGSDNFINGVR